MGIIAAATWRAWVTVIGASADEAEQMSGYEKLVVS